MPPPLHTRNHENLLLHLTGLSGSRHDLGWLQEYSQQKALHILTRMIPPALNYTLRYYTIHDAKMYPYFRISCLFLKPMGCYGRFSFISTTRFRLLLHLARFPLYVLCLIYFPVVFLFDYHFPRYFFPRVFFSCYPTSGHCSVSVIFSVAQFYITLLMNGEQTTTILSVSWCCICMWYLVM